MLGVRGRSSRSHCNWEGSVWHTTTLCARGPATTIVRSSLRQPPSVLEWRRMLAGQIPSPFSSANSFASFLGEPRANIPWGRKKTLRYLLVLNHRRHMTGGGHCPTGIPPPRKHPPKKHPTHTSHAHIPSSSAANRIPKPFLSNAFPLPPRSCLDLGFPGLQKKKKKATRGWKKKRVEKKFQPRKAEQNAATSQEHRGNRGRNRECHKSKEERQTMMEPYRGCCCQVIVFAGPLPFYFPPPKLHRMRADTQQHTKPNSVPLFSPLKHPLCALTAW